MPPPIDIDIGSYLHNSASHHEHSYSKYALVDCSWIFSFLSNYNRSSTLNVVAHSFIDIITQVMESAIQVSLDSPNFLTRFLRH